MPGAAEPVAVDGCAGSSRLGSGGGELGAAGFDGGRAGRGGVPVDVPGGVPGGVDGAGCVVGASICCAAGFCGELPSGCGAATVSPDPPPDDCVGDEV